MPHSRCGSLARIGLPLAVCWPESAQAFEPGLKLGSNARGKQKIHFGAIAALEHRSLLQFFPPCRGQVAIHLQAAHAVDDAPRPGSYRSSENIRAAAVRDAFRGSDCTPRAYAASTARSAAGKVR